MEKIEIKGSIFVTAKSLLAAEKKLGTASDKLVAAGAKVSIPGTGGAPANPPKYKALTAAQAAKLKSKGHLVFHTGPDQVKYEYYITASNDIHKAPVAAVIDIDTGHRIGRFEMSVAQARLQMEVFPFLKKALGIKPSTSKQAIVEPEPVKNIEQKLTIVARMPGVNMQSLRELNMAAATCGLSPEQQIKLNAMYAQTLPRPVTATPAAAPTGSLHARVAHALGWSLENAQALSLASLRELVSLKYPKLTAELTARIQGGGSLKKDIKPRKAGKGVLRADMAWLGEPPPIATVDLKTFAREVNHVAKHAEVERYHADRAFIYSVWQYLDKAGTVGKLGYKAFQDRVIEAHRAGLVRLTRADPAEAMNLTAVLLSETRYLSAEYHFIAYDTDTKGEETQ